MQRNGQHQQRSPFPAGAQAFGPFRIDMEMGKQHVHHHDKQNPQYQSAGRRDPSCLAGGFCFFDRRDQETPHGSRDHDACREAEKNTVHRISDPFTKKEDQRRSQRRHQKGKSGPRHRP